MSVHMADIPAQRLKPFQRELDLPPGNVFLRALTARVVAQLCHGSASMAARVAERLWPSDRIVQRAVATPAMVSVAGWAAELARTVVAAALEAMGPESAGARLLQQALVLNLDGVGAVSVPNFVAAAGNASFVAEGAPIPVRQLTGPAALLTPFKLAVIAALTREMVEGSNAEQIISDVLMRSAGLALDAVLFGSAAATAAQPAGIRNGIAALTASNNSDFQTAVYEDITTLLGAVSAVAGAGRIVLVMSPGRAAAIYMRTARTADNVTVLGSAALGNDLIAVAPNGLAAAFSPEPEIETSSNATVVMDTAPGAAGTMGPERSMFQTDAVALKMRWPVTWAVRNSAAVAWITPTWK